MPTGRHARPNDEPAAQVAAGPVVASAAPKQTASKTVAATSPARSNSVSTPVQVATPAGRRAQPAQDRQTPPAPVPANSGPGRRRKPAAEVAVVAAPSAPAAEAPKAPAAAGTGRRRKPAPDLALVEAPKAPAATGTGRRRKPAVEAALPSLAAGSGQRRAVAAPAPVVPAAVVPSVVEPEAAEETLAPVVSITAARRTAGATGSRRKAKSRTLALPGTPSLLAGAAAVAVAAAGVLGAAGSGAAGAGSTDLARASAAGLTASLSQADQQQPADRAEARASRERARKALAQRQKVASAKKAKQLEIAKVLKLAKERAARLAQLAKSYRLPVQGFHLTAGFGASSGLWSAGHTGQDFACPYGTAIRALGSGRIVSAGWDGSYGWKIVQILNDGTEIWYAHQSKMLVKSGYVNAGDVIGRVGSTGNSTGPHLHLEVRIDGKPIDPMPWLRAHGLIR